MPELWTEDPRLAAVYDAECAGRRDHDFYLELAHTVGAGSVVDIGCGTGVLAVDLASRGYEVTGVDPAAAMLDVARTRCGSTEVEWIHGDAGDVPSGGADLVLMTGHVAQYFIDDDAWALLLAQVHRILTAGGRLAFESRSPAVDWAQRWTRERTIATYLHPDGGEFTAWVEMSEVTGSSDSYTTAHVGHTLLPDGEHLACSETLRFRSADEIRVSLETAGFDLETVWGDWDKSPVTPNTSELIVLARARVRYRSTVMDSNRWERFSARAGDIIISTPGKSGTTWMQMICALLIFQCPTFDRSLDLISPWLDMQTRDIGDVIADVEAQQHRRFVKTHTPLDGLRRDPAVTYICVGRDPRDVAISWAHFEDNIDHAALFTARDRAVGNDDLAELLGDWDPAPADPLGRFWHWVDDARRLDAGHVNLASTMHHLATFWAVREEPNVVLVHYADLQRDLEGEMRRIAQRLDIAVDDELLPDLVAAAGFDTMRARADEVAPDSSQRLWKSNRAFFHSGRSGQWRDLLDGAGRRRYAERVTQLAPPDLVEWAHHEPVGSL